MQYFKDRIVIILVGLLCLVSLFSWYRYKQTQINKLVSEVQRYQGMYERAEASIHALAEHSEKQFSELSDLQRKNQEYREKTQDLEKILSKHNLEEIAERKPGLLQNRINKGTSDVLNEFENITGFNKENQK